MPKVVRVLCYIGYHRRCVVSAFNRPSHLHSTFSRHLCFTRMILLRALWQIHDARITWPRGEEILEFGSCVSTCHRPLLDQTPQGLTPHATKDWQRVDVCPCKGELSYCPNPLFKILTKVGFWETTSEQHPVRPHAAIISRSWKVRYKLAAPAIGLLPRQGLITSYNKLSTLSSLIIIEYIVLPLPCELCNPVLHLLSPMITD